MGKLNVTRFTIFFVACLVSCALASYHLNDKEVKRIEEQFSGEMQASLVYQSYGHYFENSILALHGFAKYFHEKSLEEREKADKLITYLNQRNARVTVLPSLPTADKELDEKSLIDSPVRAIQKALTIETKLFDMSERIAQGTDAQLKFFIEQDFLSDRILSIKKLEDLITLLKKIGNNPIGYFLLDRWLLEDKKM